MCSFNPLLAAAPVREFTMLTLADICVGGTAEVIEVLGDDSLAARIMEMGVIDGEQVKVIGRAPLGDPIELELRGYRLSLRTAEARRVTVNTVDETGLS